MRKAGWFIITILILSACNNNKSSTHKVSTTDAPANTKWDEQNKVGFMQKCIGGTGKQMDSTTASAYCSCMLNKLQAKYPVADSTANMSLSEMMTMAKDCVP